MARTIAPAQEDPIIDLFVAVVKQAQADLTLHERTKGNNCAAYPTRNEKEDAAKFLEALKESAFRRTD